MIVTSAPPPETITWGARCRCGTPDLPHRHGTSESGTEHLAVERPWSSRS